MLIKNLGAMDNEKNGNIPEVEVETCLDDDLTYDLENETSVIQLDGEDFDSKDFELSGSFSLGQELKPASGGLFRSGLCLRSRLCDILVYLVIVSLFLASIVALLVVCATVVVPYYRTSHFVATTCTALRVARDREHVRCTCGAGCDTYIPCIRIYVQYNLNSNTGTKQNTWAAYIYENEKMLNRQCSIYAPCETTAVHTEAGVTAMLEKYGISAGFYTCYYNPRHKDEVIRTKYFRVAHVVHGLLWPLLVCVCTGSTLALLFHDQRCAYS